MSWADITNALFEGGMIWFLGRSVFQLYRDKQVKGIHPSLLFWTTSWAIWNLYYYPSLGQSYSFWAGLGVVGVNFVWLVMMLYYRKYPGGK